MICPDSDSNHAHITLDWDNPDKPEPSIYRNAYGASCIHYRKSSSGKYHHLLVCFTKPMTVFDMFLARAVMHDDPSRFIADWARWKETHDTRFAIGVIFDMKDGKLSGEWNSLPKPSGGV